MGILQEALVDTMCIDLHCEKAIEWWKPESRQPALLKVTTTHKRDFLHGVTANLILGGDLLANIQKMVGKEPKPFQYCFERALLPFS